MDTTNKNKPTGKKKLMSDFSKKGAVNSLMAASVMFLGASSLHAATLNDINFGSLPGGKLEIRMDFDEAPPEPTSYTIDQPARIAIDLEGVESGLDTKKHTLGMENAQSVVVLEADGRTRVVVNLIELAGYETRVENNSLFITVGEEGVKDFLKPAEPALASNMAKTKSSFNDTGKGLRNVEFQRGADGEGEIYVELTDSDINVDSTVEGSYIRISFEDATLPEDLLRRFDVSDFATPIESFDVSYIDGVATLSLKPTGDYDYIAYQTDETYVVSVKPLSKAEIEAKKNEFPYVGDRLSLNFQDIDVRSVLQLIADFTDLNLVASDTVTGNITLRLQNVPWDQALALILKAKGLDKRQVGNVLMVAPADEIAEQERKELETKQQLAELAPLQTEYIQIKYADAGEIFALFGSDAGGDSGVEDGEAGSTGPGLLSERGQVIVDSRTNSLLITETAESLENIRRLISLLDVPVRQVLIEARIVIADNTFTEDLGVRWGFQSWDVGNNHIASVAPNQNEMRNITNQFIANPTAATPSTLNVTNNVDMGVSGDSASSIGFGYLNSDIFVNLELSAMEQTGHGEVVSQPKVITGDKQQASIRSGQEIPYLTSSSNGGTTVEFQDAVLELEVTPQITPDDRITMDIIITQDSTSSSIAGEFGAEIPVIDTTELETQVLVGNGETVVLGGIFTSQDVKTLTKTPFLGDIPFIGKLFRSTQVRNDKFELLIFITPRILSDTLID